MNEIKNEKKAIIGIDNVPGNYLESITNLDFIEHNINHKNGTFYIPITPEVFNRYNLLSPIIFIKFPFLPEYFYGEEIDTSFKDDNMINIYAEIFFDDNKTTKTTREKIENLKKTNKLVGDDIIGYIELKFDCRKPKDYRFPKPLSFKVILNDKIKKEDNPNIIKIKSNNHFKYDLTDKEEKILNDIKECIPNLSLSTISVLSEMFGYSVGCKRRISELEDTITELKEKL